MKLSAAAKYGILTLTLSACTNPVMAQGRSGGGRGARGQVPRGEVPPPGNGGMEHVPPHIQRQIEEQQRQYQQQLQQQQQQALQKYQQDLQQFDQWLKANGGSSASGNGGAASRLPNNPEAFDQWALTQRQRKARGKPYDGLYDQYRAFVDSMMPNGSQQGPSQSSAHGRRKNNQQPEATGSISDGTAPGQRAKKGGSTEAMQTMPGREKRAELRREERARELRAEEKRPLAQDQTSINLIRTVHTRLLGADHDYAGQRVISMRALGEALHHLGSPTPPRVSAVSLGNLPQGQSDAVLRNAIGTLRIVESQLAGPASSAPHHARARDAVREAIHHLEVALSIS